MNTQEAVAVPFSPYVDESFAASIFSWDMKRLYYMQSYNSFPIPIRCAEMLVIRTDDLVRWALNRRYGVTRYEFE
ncbi:hypothetical protein [Mesorhizobium sp. WSM2239]|uniref:AlpA family transcriptional regulator n=2 Tax=unclassified Mesorhizobium TaxID=325217 RepID=A0AAU8D2D1_9HYPH